MIDSVSIQTQLITFFEKHSVLPKNDYRITSETWLANYITDISARAHGSPRLTLVCVGCARNVQIFVKIYFLVPYVLAVAGQGVQTAESELVEFEDRAVRLDSFGWIYLLSHAKKRDSALRFKGS